ncbi:MAG: ATP-binding cassette domain-containing protein [Candidatus Alkaliphilus sp. MAG34]|nr:ABC transporter ATP-binding protein [Clostridiales bacterium]
MGLIVEVDNLTKQYNKAKKPAVNGISFSIGEGEFFAFLGPNGAGKTTTISILTTTLAKTSGYVRISGYNLDTQPQQIRQNIGIIFQKASLDENLTAENNIRFHACLYNMYAYRPTFKMMPGSYKNKVMDLAEIIGIKDSLFQPVKNLSGGMKRKLEIVRSLIHTPNILFLDEPTQGLDAVSRRSLWNYINEIRKKHGTTIFLTTHYIDEAEHVDRVCIINDGEIAMLGSPNEMKSRFLREELVLDAGDQTKLENELNGLGISYRKGKHLFVGDFTKYSTQEIISKLDTKLTVLKITKPSLEDAYIEFLNKSRVP